MFAVEVDFCPAYELLVSLNAAVNRATRRLLDLGNRWPARMRRQMSARLREALAAAEDSGDQMEILYLLVYLCPGKRTAEGFLTWLAGLSPAEIYELVADFIPDGYPLSEDLGGLRDRAGRALQLWCAEYFRQVDRWIISALEESAGYWTARAAEGEPSAVVEEASCGVVVDPDAGPGTVLLVPQYHIRPWNTYSPFRNLLIDHFPAEIPASAPDEPESGVLRFAHALSDPNRLKILRYLAGRPRLFTEIVRFLHLPKSTIHYHLVSLRAAGLVRVYTKGPVFRAMKGGRGVPYSGGDRLSLREAALEEQWEKLRDFLLPSGDPR